MVYDIKLYRSKYQVSSIGWAPWERLKFCVLEQGIGQRNVNSKNLLNQEILAMRGSLRKNLVNGLMNKGMSCLCFVYELLGSFA